MAGNGKMLVNGGKWEAGYWPVVGSGKKDAGDGGKWEERCWPVVGSGMKNVGQWQEMGRRWSMVRVESRMLAGGGKWEEGCWQWWEVRRKMLVDRWWEVNRWWEGGRRMLVDGGTGSERKDAGRW